MYEKARKGESLELSPRQISIFKFEIERSLEDRYVFSPTLLLSNTWTNMTTC